MDEIAYRKVSELSGAVQKVVDNTTAIARQNQEMQRTLAQGLEAIHKQLLQLNENLARLAMQNTEQRGQNPFK